MKIIVNITALFIFLLIFSQCKEEGQEQKTNFISHDETPEEKEWLKDYISPKEIWGFIDSTGKEVIPMIYDDVRDFDKNGMCLANFKGRWGFINRKNEVVISFKYLDAHPFENELALVQSFDKKYFFINAKGDKVFDCPGEECTSFKNGNSIFTISNSKGLINKDGKIILKEKYEDIIALNSQLHIVQSGNKYGIIDLKDSWKVKAEFDKIYTQKNKLIKAKKGDRYYFINTSTFTISTSTYEAASDYYHGIAAVKKGGKYLLIDEAERTLYSTNNIVKYGGEDKWIEEENGQFRFIDKAGKSLTEKWYTALYQFEEGMAGFQEGEYWGYLNDKGEEVIPAELPLIWSCKEGKIRFISQEGYGFLTKDYKIAVRPKYIEARDFQNGLARVAE